MICFVCEWDYHGGLLKKSQKRCKVNCLHKATRLKNPNSDSFHVLTKINFIIASSGQLNLSGSVQLADWGGPETTALRRNYETVKVMVNLGRLPFSAAVCSDFTPGQDVSQAPRPGSCHCVCQSRKSREGGLALRHGRG